MYLSKKVKEDIFKKHGSSKTDTGSTEGQIALFTYRINHLTDQLKNNRKDFNTERSLVKLVGKRRALLDYLRRRISKDTVLLLRKQIMKKREAFASFLIKIVYI